MKRKRALGILLCLAMSLALMLAMSLTAYAEDGIKYLDNKGEEATYTGSYTTVTGSDSGASWGEGWYVVSDDVTISERVEADGNVNLILCDGASLTVTCSHHFRCAKKWGLLVQGRHPCQYQRAIPVCPTVLYYRLIVSATPCFAFPACAAAAFLPHGC